VKELRSFPPRRGGRRIVPHVLPTSRIMKTGTRGTEPLYDFTSSYRGIQIGPRLQRGCYPSAQNSLIRAFRGITNCRLRPTGEEHERETQLLTTPSTKWRLALNSRSRASLRSSAVVCPNLANPTLNVFKGARGKRAARNPWFSSTNRVPAPQPGRQD
jgi:hypothetical protein